jgi:hypothetical protein
VTGLENKFSSGLRTFTIEKCAALSGLEDFGGMNPERPSLCSFALGCHVSGLQPFYCKHPALQITARLNPCFSVSIGG